VPSSPFRTAWLMVALPMPVALLNYLDRQMLAAMKFSFAQRGTGDVGLAVTRVDGVLLPREQQRRGRDDCSLVGKFAGVRTGYRTPGEPGICPLDAQVNLPARCSSYVLQEWMTLVAVEHPFQESAGFCAQLFALDVAESVLMAVAPEAPPDYEDFCAHIASRLDGVPRYRQRVEQLLDRPDEQFRQAATYVLEKNAELYRRLVGASAHTPTGRAYGRFASARLTSLPT